MKKVIWIVVLFVMALFAFAAVPAAFAKGSAPQVAIPPLNAQSLSFMVIAIISLLLDYAPRLAPRWDALPEKTQQLLFVCIGIVVVSILFISRCYGLIDTNIICSTQGAYDLIVNVIVVLATGYGFHKATKPTDEFKRNTLGFG